MIVIYILTRVLLLSVAVAVLNTGSVLCLK